MNAITEPPVVHYVLCSIKGTAMNRDRARCWIERDLSELIPFGFTESMRMNVELRDDGFIITFAVDGKRKPTLRKRAGKPTKVVFDVCMPAAQRDAMFNGAARLTVWASTNRLMVTV